MKKSSIFISYRREGGDFIAKLLNDRLTALGYHVFFDLETMQSGNFDKALYDAIEACDDFLILLSPGALDRCESEEDWVRKELEHALEKNKNIIPIMFHNFEFPEVLPASIDPIRYKNGLTVNTEFFEQFMDKLCHFLKTKNHKPLKRLLTRVSIVLVCFALLAGGAFGVTRLLKSLQPEPPGTTESGLYPGTQQEINLTGEMIAIVQNNLMVNNLALGAVNDLFEGADAYLKAENGNVEKLQELITLSKNALNNLPVELAIPSETLLTKLSDSPFSATGLSSFHTMTNMMTEECKKMIDVIEKICVSLEDMDKEEKLYILGKYKVYIEELSKSLGYRANALLLPITNSTYLDSFLNDVLPGFQNIFLSDSSWNTNSESLDAANKEANNKSEEAMDAIKDALGSDFNEQENYESAFAEGKAAGYEAGYAEGLKNGTFNDACTSESQGYVDGYKEGYTEGYNAGKAQYNAGSYDAAFAEGKAAGYEAGYAEGLRNGTFDDSCTSQNGGYIDGYSEGYAEGYAKGKEQYEASIYDTVFAEGKTAGYDAGYADGMKNGTFNDACTNQSKGYADGYIKGYAEGYAVGKAQYDAAFSKGKTAGYEAGYAEGLKNGTFNDACTGKSQGYMDGYKKGYAEGYPVGKAEYEATLHTHIAGKWTVIKEATETETGLRAQYCIECQEKMGEETIPVLSIPSLDYIVNEDENTCTIIGMGSFAGENLVIPSVLDGYTVTVIGNKAFAYQTGLKSVSIPNTVTNIRKSAFLECTSLKSVSLEEGLECIGGSAFGGCTALTSIVIPNSVTVFGVSENGGSADGVFYYCSSLSSVVIGNGVTYIPIDTFYHCTSLTSVTLPDGVTSIGISAFRECYSLSKIELPDSVTSIGASAFESCHNLQSAILGDSVTSIDDSVFRFCYALQSVMLGDCVTSIGNDAFSYCSSLETIELPDSVTSIGEYAFNACINLKTIEVPKSVTSIGNRAFFECYNLAKVVLPSSLNKLGSGVFLACHRLAVLTYNGTKASWKGVSAASASDWNGGSDIWVIVCTDGQIQIDE